MGIPLSLFLIAGGAIVAFAVTDNANGVDLYAVGWILMGAGAVLLVLSLIMWDSWAGGGFWHRAGPPPRRPPPPPY